MKFFANNGDYEYLAKHSDRRVDSAAGDLDRGAVGMTMPTNPTADRARLREIAESLCGLQAYTSFEKSVQELARGVIALTEPVDCTDAVLAERERCWQICNKYRKPTLTVVDLIAVKIKSGK